MYKFGELADEAMADKILRDLQKRDIPAFKQQEQGFLGLYVEKQEDLEEAFDTYRVRLGFAPHFEMSPEMEQIARLPFGIATKLVMLFSLTVSVTMLLMDSTDVMGPLYFSQSVNALMPEILQGEYWRLITPIFLHFGLLHIIFNLLCFKDFGSLIEHQHGLKNFILWLVVIGLASNIAQYLVQGPRFGGLSGVLFGFLGIVWMYKTFNPKSEYSLPKSSVVILLVWFVVCLVGILPGIANTAHGMGLFMGMVIGITRGLKAAGKLHRPVNLLLYSSATLLILLATLSVEYYRLDQIFFYQTL